MVAVMSAPVAIGGTTSAVRGEDEEAEVEAVSVLWKQRPNNAKVNGRSLLS